MAKNELRLSNLVRKEHRFGRVDAVEDESAGLRKDSAVAHFRMNLIGHKQIYRIHDRLEI